LGRWGSPCMSNLPVTALNWLTIGFDWALLPVGIILIALALRPDTRHHAAWGFLVAAGISAAILSLLLATSVFYFVGYGKAIASLLLNFGPSVTRHYIVALAQQNGQRLLAVSPMIVTAVSSSVAGVYLRRGREPVK